MKVKTEEGEVEILDEERTECEVYTRVMGYHRPVNLFNAGKRQEHRDRKFFLESKARLHGTG